jgi:hypothetical protein
LKTFEEHYVQKDYPNALLVLKNNQSQFTQSLWHYNLGTVYGEMNNWPMARFHFILAEKSGLHSKELIQNKKLAETKLDVTRLEKPLDASDYYIKISYFAADGPLLTIGFLFLAIGIWLLKKKASLKSAAIFALTVATPLMLDFWIDSWPRKITSAPKTVYEGPSSLFGAIGEIPPGIMVITNKKDEWEKIIYPSRFSGWIKSDHLESLELK